MAIQKEYLYILLPVMILEVLSKQSPATVWAYLKTSDTLQQD